MPGPNGVAGGRPEVALVRGAVFAALLGAAAGCAPDDGGTTPPHQQPTALRVPVALQPPEEADENSFEVEPLGRVLYGCVATYGSDPVSNVRVVLDGEEVARTSRWGDFCVTGLPPGEHTFSFERAEFESAEFTMPVDVERQEALPLLMQDDGWHEGLFRVTVASSPLCGPRGADVVVRDAESGAELVRTTTSVLGTFLVPKELRGRAVRVSVAGGDPPVSTVSSGSLTPWWKPHFFDDRAMAEVRLHLEALERESGRTLIWFHRAAGARTARAGPAMPTPPIPGQALPPWSVSIDERGLTAWLVASTPTRVVTRPIPLHAPVQDLRVETRPAARLVLHPRADLSADALPAPGDVFVVAPWGSDGVISAIALEDVPAPLSRQWPQRHADVTPVGSGLATPYLDIGDGVPMVLHADRGRDRRVLHDARLPLPVGADVTIHREMDVVGGTGRFVVQVDGPADPDGRLHGSLARRGGSYYRRKRIPVGEPVVFDDLCAGTFTFWFSEESPAAAGEAAKAVSGFHDIRGLRIAPGAEVTMHVGERPVAPRVKFTRTEER